MKQLVQLNGKAFFLQENFGNGIGLYKNGEKKIIGKNGKHEKISIKPTPNSPKIIGDYVENVVKISDLLLKITINGIFGYVYCQGVHSLKPEPQPNLYATIRYPKHKARCYPVEETENHKIHQSHLD